MDRHGDKTRERDTDKDTKTKHRRRVLTPRTPSRDSLDEAAETSPRPKADWTPRRRLKFYGRRLADDSLSNNQIKRLREGLLGEYGLNWRRDRERDVAAALAKAASDLREGAMGEIWRSGRAGRPTRRHVLARLLHAVSVIAAPDPALVTPSRVERVARGLSSASTRDLLLLSRWASSEFVRASETVQFAPNASRRVVGQWGGAGGAICEDHLPGWGVERVVARS